MMSPSDLGPLLPSHDRIREGPEELLIEIHPGERIYLGGYCNLEVIEGEVTVLGARIRPSPKPFPLYSPKSTALLYITTSEASASVKLTPLLEGPSLVGEGQPSLASLYAAFPGARSTCVPNLFIIEELRADSDLQALDIPDGWQTVASWLCSSPTTALVFTVGPRKVGKSTLTRFLGNTIWSKTGRVAFLDLDAGQTEFTPPGALALKLLDRTPLLGPALSHQCLVDDLVFLGASSPSDDPKGYLVACKELLETYMTRYYPEGIPLVVNTMGWVTGLGLSLLQSLLRLVPISHLVAFSPSGPGIPEYVQQALFEKTPFCLPFAPEETPNVAYVEPSEASGSQTARLTRFTPAELRDSTFAAYFSGTFDPAQDRIVHRSLNLRATPPLAVPTAAIRLKPADKATELPSKLHALALNLAVVGLAHMNAAGKVVKTIGLGLVRGIDQAKGLYFILTPVPLEMIQAEHVNCFVYGRVHLPAAFLASPENADGPYLDYTAAFSPAAIGATHRKVRNNIGRKYGGQ